jgi:molecular chaperone DnaK
LTPKRLPLKFQKSDGIDLKKDKFALQRLKAEAEKTKHMLSESLEGEINLPFITADQSGPKHLNLKLSRSKLETLCADLIQKVVAPCETCLKDSGLSKTDITDVILVGGMTRMPKVVEKVREIFGQEPSKGVNPDEVVAVGAAIQGGVLKGEVKDVLLLDVTPLSLGIETLGGVFTKLIEKNTTIPSKKSQVFSTAADNQPAVSIHVLQGEREMAGDNKTLGRFDLMGLPPAPRGVPQIEVTFDIDANGIVHVSAKDMGTGKSQSIKITANSGLSDDEIQKMVKDAELHAAEDKKKSEAIHAKNHLDSLIYQTEKSLKEMGDKVEGALRQEIESTVTRAKEELEKADLEKIKSTTEELNQLNAKLAEKLYNQASAQNPQGSNGQTATEEAQAGAENKSDKKDDDVVDADYKEV